MVSFLPFGSYTLFFRGLGSLGSAVSDISESNVTCALHFSRVCPLFLQLVQLPPQISQHGRCQKGLPPPTLPSLNNRQPQCVKSRSCKRRQANMLGDCGASLCGLFVCIGPLGSVGFLDTHKCQKSTDIQVLCIQQNSIFMKSSDIL